MLRVEMLLGLLALCVLAAQWALAGEPTNAAELEAQYGDALSWEQYEAWRALVADLPEDEAAWEHVLEGQLGSFYFPIHVRNRIRPEFDPFTSEWGFLQDDPELPSVLLIGDSISRSYTVSVRKLLEGVANVHRAPANCGSTELGLKHLDLWLAQGDGEWDVIYWNFGIHDRNRAPEEYASNLGTLVERLRKTGATLIFARTTPFENADAPGVDASTPINATSDEVMARLGVQVDDLHGAVIEQVAEVQADDHTHFKAEGIALMAAHVAATIRRALEGE